MSYTSIANVGTLHSGAMRGLNFYNEEIKILELRLFEIASKNSSFEARQGIGHFQNQFVIQQNNIHDLKHKLKDHIQIMGAEAFVHAGHVSRQQQEVEKQLMSDYSILEKIINDLRHEFNTFLSKWM